MIDLSSLNGYITLTKFQMKTVVSLMGSIRKGDVMFSIDLKDTSFQVPIHLDSWHYLWIVLNRKVLSALSSRLQFFFCSPGLHQGVRPGLGVGPSARVSPPLLP